MKKQNKKSDFRRTKTWKDFRTKKFEDQDGIDPVTNKKLYKGANLHHLDLNEEHYEDISDETHFVLLNKKTHDCIHFLYNYYKVDPEVLERVRQILQKMKEINNLH